MGQIPMVGAHRLMQLIWKSLGRWEEASSSQGLPLSKQMLLMGCDLPKTKISHLKMTPTGFQILKTAVNT